MIESRNPEKCYYCDKPAEYNDLVGTIEEGFSVAGVCTKHIRQYGLS